VEYRDERDALRGRVENLEDQLASAKRATQTDGDRAARVEQLERQMAEARRLLDQLGRELDEVRGRPHRPPVAPMAAAASAAIILAGAVMLAVGHRSRPVVVVPQPTAVTVPAPEPVPVEITPPTPAPTATATAEATARTVTATWKATVTRATGRAPGGSCTIEAKLTARGDEIQVADLEVLCGGTPLYRSSDPLNGMSSLHTRVEEESGPAPGTYVYALSYEDKGPRSGTRAEISLDTAAKAASVWRDSAPGYRVELVVPPQSAPLECEPLLEATAKALRKTARVVEATGPSPVKVGAQCTVRSTPIRSTGQCLTRVECGSVRLYGAPGAGVSGCATDAEQVVSALDDSTTPNDGDPAMELDTLAGRATMHDGIGGAAWKVTLRLDGAR